jgi:hypothetical protein
VKRFGGVATLVSSAAVLAAPAADVAQRGDTRAVAAVGLAAGLAAVGASAVALWKQRQR